MKSYLVWDGRRWAPDDCEEVVRLAQETARSIHHEAANADDTDAQRRLGRWAVASQSASRINAMLQQARPHIAIRINSLDADPWLFNCQNGTIDLRTGERHDHDPADLITKLAPVDYDSEADAPRFKQFLKEILVGDDVIGFVQRFAGYSLTGDTRERALAILWGGGKNGKSTLVELLRHVMGDYAQNTDVETVLAKKHQGVGNEVAALKGARLVSCAEVEKGRRLAESKVKQLTGSDTVTARYLFGEPFDFKPAFKLWMSTNNKPEIRGTDDAIWDRIRLIPFTQRFEGRAADPKLPEELRKESSGVLAWMVAGCLAWQEHGLGEPEEVTNATAEYRSEMDSLAAFIDECCVIHKDASVTMASLYARYSEWCEKSNETAETKRRFGNLLTDRGFPADRGTGNVPTRTGIGLLTNHEPPPDGGGERRSEGNSSNEQVTLSDATKSNKETDDTNAMVTTVTDSYHSVTFGNSQNPCKSIENPEELPSVTQKSITYPMTAPREETFRKQGNYGNYGNAQDEEARLLAAGWKKNTRVRGDFWISPQTGYAYAREYALEELSRQERAR